jgi:hypothetical protein
MLSQLSQPWMAGPQFKAVEPRPQPWMAGPQFEVAKQLPKQPASEPPKPKTDQCPVCKKMFSSGENMRRHARSAHGETHPNLHEILKASFKTSEEKRPGPKVPKPKN